MPSPTSSSSTTNVGLTYSQNIDALLGGSKWGGVAGTGTILAYSFPWASGGNATFSGHNGVGNYSSLNEQNATNHYALNATQQAAARAALQTWANVADIGFQEIGDTATNVGDIRFAFTSAPNLTSTGVQAWGWAGYPDSYWPSGGDVWISTLATSAANPDWSVGSHNSYSLVHELGHALGLKHSFEVNPVLPSGQESRQYTVMSYTDHPHSLFVQVTHNANGSISWKSFNVEPDTPMLYDVAAIQYIYGANLSYRTGNDVYTFDSATPFFRTIWDAGGTDTISVSNFTKGCVIDLQQGHFSKITIESDSSSGINWSSPPPTPTYDGTDNLAIAFGCVIENAIGGGGNDTLIGNDANNSLDGGGGNDTIDGGSGNDTVVYTGNRANFTITQSGNNYTVKDGAGTEGTDAVTNVERLSFSDGNIWFDVSQNQLAVTRLYQAVMGRAPDSGGLDYWAAQRGSGMTTSHMALGFMASAEYSTRYGNPDNPTFVNLLYHNVLGRDAEPAGRDYWDGVLGAGVGRADVIAGFADSVELTGIMTARDAGGVFMV